MPPVAVVHRRFGIPLAKLVLFARIAQAREIARNLYTKRSSNGDGCTPGQWFFEPKHSHINGVLEQFPTNISAIHFEVQTIDKSTNGIVCIVIFPAAGSELCLREFRFIVFVGIGPQVHVDAVQCFGCAVGIFYFNISLQHVALVVQAHVYRVVYLLLEISLLCAGDYQRT